MNLNSFSYALKITKIFILILLSLPISAQIKTFKIKQNKIRMHYPKNWQFAYNFLSSPLTLLGPVENNIRPVITISDSPIKNYKFNEKEIERDQSKYREEKKKWVKKRYAKIVKFIPYKKEKWDNIAEVHSIGLHYKLNGKVYKEMSYFFNCHNKLHNSTTLITHAQRKGHEKTLLKMLRSMKCN